MARFLRAHPPLTTDELHTLVQSLTDFEEFSVNGPGSVACRLPSAGAPGDGRRARLRRATAAGAALHPPASVGPARACPLHVWR